MVTYQDIVQNETVKTYIRKADIYENNNQKRISPLQKEISFMLSLLDPGFKPPQRISKFIELVIEISMVDEMGGCQDANGVFDEIDQGR